MRISKLENFRIVTGFDPLKTQWIKAYPILDLDVPIKLMVHKEQSIARKRWEWVVYEFTTGQLIELEQKATTRDMAVLLAVQKIRALPPGKLEAIMEGAPKINEEDTEGGER